MCVQEQNSPACRSTKIAIWVIKILVFYQIFLNWSFRLPGKKKMPPSVPGKHYQPVFISGQKGTHDLYASIILPLIFPRVTLHKRLGSYATVGPSIEYPFFVYAGVRGGYIRINLEYIQAFNYIITLTTVLQYH